jgi:hypothetical protein
MGLFVVEGNPMGKRHAVFVIASCQIFDEIKDIVISEGGIVETQWCGEAIHLVDDVKSKLPIEKPQDHAVYSSRFVFDSWNFGELQDLQLYEMGREETEEETNVPPKIKRRAKYSATEEEEMRKYMKANPKAIHSVLYWGNAVKCGLKVNRSAASLRDHSKRMRGVIEVTQKQSKIDVSSQSSIRSAKPAAMCSARKPVEWCLSTPVQQPSESVISELVNTPLSLSSRFDTHRIAHHSFAKGSSPSKWEKNTDSKTHFWEFCIQVAIKSGSDTRC